MQLIIRTLIILCALGSSWALSSQTIRVDGTFDDWTGISPIYVDDLGDGQSNGIDIERIWMTNDQTHIYMRFQINREINLQDDNEFSLYLDFDSDINTGFKINGIGAEVRVFFGERLGILTQGDNTEVVNFVPLVLFLAPTVTGNEFEFAIRRSIEESDIDLFANGEVQFRMEDNGFNGDDAPNDLGGISYFIDNSIITDIAPTVIKKNSTSDFRFLTYNIKADQLFDANRRDNFERLFQSIDPDIIALQEVRDFSSAQTRNLVQEFLPGTWFHKKHGFDIVTLSRYPIRFSENINGNAAYFLDVNGQEILVVNAHLPCCDNNIDRQKEVDGIMQYIREGKLDNNDYPISQDMPIIIAGDMNFVGDASQPNTFITGDIFANGTYGPDFAPDWDGTSLSDADPNTTGTFGNFTWFNPFGSFYPGKLDWIIYSDSRIVLDNTFALWSLGLSSNQLSESNLQRLDVTNASDHLPVVADFSFGTSSTDDFVSINVEIYPNPAAEELIVTIPDNDVESLEIISSIGRTIMSQSTINDRHLALDIHQWDSGTYYIIFRTVRGRSVRQFIKI